jgi:hypothetical protein
VKIFLKKHNVSGSHYSMAREKQKAFYRRRENHKGKALLFALFASFAVQSFLLSNLVTHFRTNSKVRDAPPDFEIDNQVIFAYFGRPKFEASIRSLCESSSTF